MHSKHHSEEACKKISKSQHVKVDQLDLYDNFIATFDATSNIVRL